MGGSAWPCVPCVQGAPSPALAAQSWRSVRRTAAWGEWQCRAPTWQVQQRGLEERVRQVLHLAAEGKHGAAQPADQEVEQVEHLLRGPSKLWHAQLDADDLHLQACRQNGRGQGTGPEVGARHSRLECRISGGSSLAWKAQSALCTKCSGASGLRRRGCVAQVCLHHEPSTHQCNHPQDAVRYCQAIKRAPLPRRALINVLPPASGRKCHQKGGKVNKV